MQFLLQQVSNVAYHRRLLHKELSRKIPSCRLNSLAAPDSFPHSVALLIIHCLQTINRLQNYHVATSRFPFIETYLYYFIN